MPEFLSEIRAAIENDVPLAVVTIVRGEPLGKKLLVYEDGQTAGSFGDPVLDRKAIDTGLDRLGGDESGLAALTPDVDAFVDVYARPPHLIINGAVHTAIALSAYAKILGFRVTVADARERFASTTRFPNVDELIVAWPDEALAGLRIDSRTYIAILTHDPKFDEPALLAALAQPARYIGAIGSRKTSLDRAERLHQKGITDEQLARIHAPIGLNIGGRTPEEVALSIAAEIIAVRRGPRPGIKAEAPATESAAAGGAR
jgi:xanthine dehydrogenase accessory factor